MKASVYQKAFCPVHKRLKDYSGHITDIIINIKDVLDTVSQVKISNNNNNNNNFYILGG